MKNFNVGEAVIFCNGWGDTYSPEKLYRWGELRAGFITDIEQVSSQLAPLYIVGTVDEYDSTKVRFRLLGAHLIFRVDEKELAMETLRKYCEEVS